MHQRLVDQRQDVVRAMIGDLRDAVDKRLVAVEQRGFRAWLSRQWAAFRRPLAFVKDRK